MIAVQQCCVKISLFSPVAIMPPFLGSLETSDFCLENEWFCRFKFDNIENHEKWMEGFSLATLIISTLIHIFNGFTNIKDNTGAEYQVNCVMMNIVRNETNFYRVELHRVKVKGTGKGEVRER